MPYSDKILHTELASSISQNDQPETTHPWNVCSISTGFVITVEMLPRFSLLIILRGSTLPFHNCVIPPNGYTLIKRECVPGERGEREGKEGEGRERRKGRERVGRLLT